MLNTDIKIKIFESIPNKELTTFWLKNKKVCKEFILKNSTSLIRHNLEILFANLVEIEKLKEIDDFLDAFHTLLYYKNLRLLGEIYPTEEFALKWRHFIPMKEWLEFESISESFITKYHLELSMFDLYVSGNLTSQIAKKYYLEIKEGDYYGGGYGATETLEMVLETLEQQKNERFN